MSLPRAYSVRDLAEAADVNPATICRLINTGQLHAFKVGQRWRIPGSVALAFITGNEPPTPESHAQEKATPNGEAVRPAPVSRTN